MATVETAGRKSDGPVRYHGGEVLVELGDHNPLHWTGVALDNGTFTAILVDPDTGCSRKGLVFLGRGPTDGVPSVPPAPFE